jgi:hypothetical protein
MLETRLEKGIRIMAVYLISRMTFKGEIILGRIDAINDSVYANITIGNKGNNHTLHAYKPINTLYKSLSL